MPLALLGTDLAVPDRDAQAGRPVMSVGNTHHDAIGGFAAESRRYVRVVPGRAAAIVLRARGPVRSLLVASGCRSPAHHVGSDIGLAFGLSMLPSHLAEDV